MEQTFDVEYGSNKRALRPKKIRFQCNTCDVSKCTQQLARLRMPHTLLLQGWFNSMALQIGGAGAGVKGRPALQVHINPTYEHQCGTITGLSPSGDRAIACRLLKAARLLSDICTTSGNQDPPIPDFCATAQCLQAPHCFQAAAGGSGHSSLGSMCMLTFG